LLFFRCGDSTLDTPDRPLITIRDRASVLNYYIRVNGRVHAVHRWHG